ncbi:hypothetical protein F4819DRAFT_507751 [Hypoxylon fuscum]|nr:hypothetical protein F4819DRAFT_507751 [Hypoxylon fuscum]
MAVAVAPSCPLGNDPYRQSMIDYAFSTHNYALTPKEVDEIVTQSYWDSVDSFCIYMMQANFGQPIAGTSNVKLPSNMRIYTDEEVDAMDAELRGRPRETRTFDTYDDTDLTVDQIQESGSLEFEAPSDFIEEDHELDEIDVAGEFEGEYLPIYIPDVLPPYAPSKISLELQAEIPPPYYSEEYIPEEDAPAEDTLGNEYEEIIENAAAVDSVEDVVEDDSVKKGEPEACKTSRLAALHTIADQKLQKAKQKLARGFELISPNKVLGRARELKKRLHRR